MKKENRIKNKVENYLKAIFTLITNKKAREIDENYNIEKLNYSSYEKCRTEISMQMLRDRILF